MRLGHTAVVTSAFWPVGLSGWRATVSGVLRSRSRRWFALLFCAAAGLVCASIVAAATSSSSTACATTTGVAHTVAVDGAGVATVGGDPLEVCATATATAETVTTTQTVTTAVAGSTTAPATTTVPATTTSSSAPSYDSEIAYTQSRPAFVPARTVDVTDAASFKSALTNLRAGDLVVAAADFTVPGETIVNERPSSTAVIDLSQHVVKFVYSAGSNFPAVWLDDPTNLRIYGGDLSTVDTGGACLTNYGSQNVLWWGFAAHDCGGTGAGFSGANAGPTTNDDFQGTIWKVGQNLAWDPHTEKGSGEHCANLDDKNIFAFSDNRFAFFCHDIPTGAAIEYGASQAANPKPVRNTIILKAVNLTFVSKVQTGGNAIQFWGVAGQSADVKYLEVSNAQGYGVFDGGMYSGSTLAGITVEYGRASSTNLNPRYAGQGPWQTDRGVVYGDVQPAP